MDVLIFRLWVVSYTFHFVMMVLTVLPGIFKALEIFLYPSPDVDLHTNSVTDVFWEIFGVHAAVFV